MPPTRLSVLNCVAILAVGCSSATTPNVTPTTARTQPPAGSTEKGGLTDVTLYLPGMNQKLKIFWGDWPNAVKQALLELPGVESVEDEWERELFVDEDLDLLFVSYRADRITLAQVLEKIKEHGFDAEVKKWAFLPQGVNMSDESNLNAMPAAGCWTSKQPVSPGATEQQPVNSPVPSDLPTAASGNCWTPKQPVSPGATESQSADNSAVSNRAESFANFGALLSAFIASSWCWLPPLLILGGISGAGMTTFLQDYRPIFMVATFGLLGLAFYMTYRPRPTMVSEGGDAEGASPNPMSRIMRFNKIMLWAATIVAVSMLFFPQALTNYFASEGEVAPEMHQTLVRIEGMTWHTWTPRAEKALKTAPGVLAVKVDYETKLATVGTEPGKSVPKAELLAALESIGYKGEIVEPAGER